MAKVGCTPLVIDSIGYHPTPVLHTHCADLIVIKALDFAESIRRKIQRDHEDPTSMGHISFLFLAGSITLGDHLVDSTI